MSINNLLSTSKERTGELRIFANMIDFIILIILSVNISNLQKANFTNSVIIFVVLELTYFIFLETLTGCTLGKFVFGIRVVNNDCEKPKIKQSFIRAVFWLLEANPILIIIPPITYYVIQHTPRKQRLGDKLASTYVVKTKSLKEYKKIQSMNINEYHIIKKEMENKLPQYYDNFESKRNGLITYKQKVRIVGTEGINFNELFNQVNNGERFVVFKYSIFLFAITFKGISSIYYKKNSLAAISARIRCTLLSSAALILSIIFFCFLDYSNIKILSSDVTTNIASIVTMIIIAIFILVPVPSIIINIKGGIDVTDEVLNYFKMKKDEKLNYIDKVYLDR